MNFLNFLTSGASRNSFLTIVFNFNLQAARPDAIRENTVLVQPNISSHSSSMTQGESLAALGFKGVMEATGEKEENLN